jgi:hypothetical protein
MKIEITGNSAPADAGNRFRIIKEGGIKPLEAYLKGSDTHF